MSHVRFPATGFEVSFNLASQANVGRSKCDGWRGWSRVIVVILILFGTFAPNLSTQMTPGPKCPADLLQRPTPLMWDAFPAPALFYKESDGSQLCEEHKLSKDCLKVMLQDGDVFWQSSWVSATNITRNCPSHSDQFHWWLDWLAHLHETWATPGNATQCGNVEMQCMKATLTEFAFIPVLSGNLSLAL